MIHPKYFENKEHPLISLGHFWLIITALYSMTFCGCLLEFDPQEAISSSSNDVYDGFDPADDDNITFTDNGPQDASKGTETDFYDDVTLVTPGDTETESSIDDDIQNALATFCEEAEEEEYMFLECGNEGVISSIDFASFGQYEGSCTGGNPAIGNCHFDGTDTVIEAICLGRSNCQLIADKKEIFDDPCKNDEHSLIAKYTCRYETACPKSSLKSVPGKCGCNTPDHDSDGDGSADCNDKCENDPFKIKPGKCGCGQAEGTCGLCTNVLMSTERLYVGKHICSENGLYFFGMTESGNLALWSKTETLWDAGVTGGWYVHMQLYGNLVVYSEELEVVWAANTGDNAGSILTLENDSHVTVSMDGKKKWEIGGP